MGVWKLLADRAGNASGNWDIERGTFWSRETKNPWQRRRTGQSTRYSLQKCSSFLRITLLPGQEIPQLLQKDFKTPKVYIPTSCTSFITLNSSLYLISAFILIIEFYCAFLTTPECQSLKPFPIQAFLILNWTI